MDKVVIREKYLEMRRAMPAEEAAERSADIIDRLVHLPAFTSAGAFLIYVASKDNEVDTKPLIRRLLKHIQPVLVPIAQPDGQLGWSRLRKMSELEPARFGILEPREDARRLMVPPKGSLVVAPGIAFSVEGWRIGYGGGYFDRFLGGFKGGVIGLAYDFQIVNHLPHAPHDVPVHIVVTETAIYRRKM